VKLHVDQRFARVTVERFAAAYHSEEFNNAVASVAGLRSRRLLYERTRDDGVRERRVRLEPDTKLPAAIRKLVDSIGKGGITYDEVSTYDASTHEVRFHIDSKANDRVRVVGTIRFLGDADGVRRIIDADIEVKAPWVGGVIERFIESETVKGYAKIAAFLQRWLDDHAV
jgi:hypothetical protein